MSGIWTFLDLVVRIQENLISFQVSTVTVRNISCFLCGNCKRGKEQEFYMHSIYQPVPSFSTQVSACKSLQVEYTL